MRRRAGAGVECLSEMVRAEAGQGRQLGKADILAEPRLHMLSHPPELPWS